MEVIVEALPFQKKFLDSETRYPALVSAIGTGKTYMLLLKIWAFCQEYPNSLSLIVRKEYTDLRDSTLKDFEHYFDVTIDSNKEYHFNNGSVIMFRHGAELNVLKNINLSIAGIEQAEEFDTDEAFTFIRDRLRRDNAPYRQLCVIANTRGHNWIWKLWKNNPPSEDFKLWEATTFDNAENLPKDFIDDLKHMAIESPNHYRRFVMNDWEESELDDYLFTVTSLEYSARLGLEEKPGHKIISCDVARFGDDEIVFTILQKKGLKWEQIFQEGYRNKDLMWTTGKFLELKRESSALVSIVDDDGVGGGVTDRLREQGVDVKSFRGGLKAKDEEMYPNKRSEVYFKLKEMIDNGILKILDDQILKDQLMTIRYKYNSKGQRVLLSKDDLRKEGIKSPDRADALMMAVSVVERSPVKKHFEVEHQKVY